MSENESMRQDILSLIDDFIEQIQRIRNILFGMSLSAIILAPLAIVLSVYLILHPALFAVLEIENDFGIVLIILLGAVIVISGIWFFTGVRQYRSMSTWKNRYDAYSHEKEEMDKKIASQFGLDQQE
jgi:hypothetical protein